MRPNPFDEMVDQYTGALEESAAVMDEFSRGVEPFDSQKLSDEEALFLYQHPAAHFPEEMLTNAEAAAMLLEQKGAVWYTKWVEDMERVMERRLMGSGGGVLPGQ